MRLTLLLRTDTILMGPITTSSQNKPTDQVLSPTPRSITLTLKRSGRVLRKIEASSASFDRYWSLPSQVSDSNNNQVAAINVSSNIFWNHKIINFFIELGKKKGWWSATHHKTTGSLDFSWFVWREVMETILHLPGCWLLQHVTAWFTVADDCRGEAGDVTKKNCNVGLHPPITFLWSQIQDNDCLHSPVLQRQHSSAGFCCQSFAQLSWRVSTSLFLHLVKLKKIQIFF